MRTDKPLTEPGMSADDPIQFQFSFRGVDIEISGESAFVDEFYRELMRDIQAARECLESSAEDPPDPKAMLNETPIWVHRCSDMMRKVYMTNADTMEQTILTHLLNFPHLRTLYINKQVFDSLLPTLTREYTLWAELTEEGRRTIQRLPSGGHKTAPQS